MTKVGRSTITSQNILKFPTNNAKLISAKNLRDFEEIINESKFNLVDDDAYDINFSHANFTATNIGDALVESKAAASAIVKIEKVTISGWIKGTITSYTHTAGVEPIAANIVAVCTVAQHGYSVGDRVSLSGATVDDAGGSTSIDGIAVSWAGIEDFTLNVCSLTWVQAKSSPGSLGDISVANWDIEVIFFYL